jgi:hypothetical protein
MATYTDYRDKVQQQYSNPETSKLDLGKYRVTTTTYPSDLGSNDLKHFVLFNINVRGKSEISKSSKKVANVNVGRDPKSASAEVVGGTALNAAVAAGVGVVAAGVVSGAAKAIAQKVFRTGAGSSNAALARADSVASGITGLAGVGAGVTAFAALQSSDLLKPDVKYRIEDAIALHLDSPPTVKYNMNYTNKELGALIGALSGSMADGAISEGGAAFGATMAKLPGAFSGVDVKSALSASSGTALNPFKETVFESVDFRSFAFKYKFFPKSKKESQDIKNIIYLFKLHMHPDLSQPNKLFFIYPSEFQITYYYENGPNPYFHKFRPCALESMEVNYGGEQFASFKDGTPVEINLSLTFRELEIITKGMIAENKDGTF